MYTIEILSGIFIAGGVWFLATQRMVGAALEAVYSTLSFQLTLKESALERLRTSGNKDIRRYLNSWSVRCLLYVYGRKYLYKFIYGSVGIAREHRLLELIICGLENRKLVIEHTANYTREEFESYSHALNDMADYHRMQYQLFRLGNRGYLIRLTFIQKLPTGSKRKRPFLWRLHALHAA